MKATTIDSNSARSNWRETLDTASAGEDVIIARFGRPVVAMIGYDDYIALLDELDDLRAARQAETILDALAAGRTDTEPWHAVKADLADQHP